MVEKLQAIPHRELMADVVQIQQTGVPFGLSGNRTEPGFVLETGMVLLESEKDEQGRYIGGMGIGGMYLRTPQRYEPVCGCGGKILAFCRVDPKSLLNRLIAEPKTRNRRRMER